MAQLTPWPLCVDVMVQKGVVGSSKCQEQALGNVKIFRPAEVEGC